MSETQENIPQRYLPENVEQLWSAFIWNKNFLNPLNRKEGVVDVSSGQWPVQSLYYEALQSSLPRDVSYEYNGQRFDGRKWVYEKQFAKGRGVVELNLLQHKQGEKNFQIIDINLNCTDPSTGTALRDEYEMKADPSDPEGYWIMQDGSESQALHRQPSTTYDYVYLDLPAKHGKKNIKYHLTIEEYDRFFKPGISDFRNWIKYYPSPKRYK